MKKTILFNSNATEKRAALLEDGKLAELVFERPDQFRILGNIYIGKVTKILPGIQSAFINIGLEKSAFIHASDVDPSLFMENGEDLIDHYADRNARSKSRRVLTVPIEKTLKEGQYILVQVIKESIGSKSPKVTTRLSLAGRFLVLVPDTDTIGVSKKSEDEQRRRELKRLIERIRPKGVGFIVRTIGLKVSEDEFVNEMEALIAAWKKVQEAALSAKGVGIVHREHGITTQVIRDLFSSDVEKVVVDNREDYIEILSYLKTVSPLMYDRVELYDSEVGLFDRYNIEKDVDRSLKRKVWLKKGGYLYFDHAEALLAVDVNTGRNVGKTNLEDTVYGTNVEAAYEICRQLRLRDIGGLIVVDFIDMRNPDNRRKIESLMEGLLEKDPSATSCTRLSKFGLMEITRKRVRPELQQLFTNICHTCNGLGRVFSPATILSQIDRWLSRAVQKEECKSFDIFVPTSVATYVEELSQDVIGDLEHNHGITLNVTLNDELEQDEFEIYREGSEEAITELYS